MAAPSFRDPTPSDAGTGERLFSGGRPIRIGVLLSGRGRGTNLGAILDSCDAGRISGRVVVALSTTPGAPALDRAAVRGVPTMALPRSRYPDDDALDGALLARLEVHEVDLLCLA